MLGIDILTTFCCEVYLKCCSSPASLLRASTEAVLIAKPTIIASLKNDSFLICLCVGKEIGSSHLDYVHLKSN